MWTRFIFKSTSSFNRLALASPWSSQRQRWPVKGLCVLYLLSPSCSPGKICHRAAADQQSVNETSLSGASLTSGIIHAASCPGRTKYKWRHEQECARSQDVSQRVVEGKTSAIWAAENEFQAQDTCVEVFSNLWFYDSMCIYVHIYIYLREIFFLRRMTNRLHSTDSSPSASEYRTSPAASRCRRWMWSAQKGWQFIILAVKHQFFLKVTVQSNHSHFLLQKGASDGYRCGSRALGWTEVLQSSPCRGIFLVGFGVISPLVWAGRDREGILPSQWHQRGVRGVLGRNVALPKAS